MKTLEFHPIRWLEEPAQVKVIQNNGRPRAYFQITAPREIERMCLGRPVEELPRILTLLSPSHHLAAAMALDQLFGVEAPDMAKNMRAALLETYFLQHDLKKIYFLLSAWLDPFAPHAAGAGLPKGLQAGPYWLNQIMNQIALSQEAAVMLGGRADHPVAAVPGGVGRFLKKEHHDRLAQIAKAHLEFSSRLAEFLRQEILGQGKALSLVEIPAPDPMPFLTLDAEGKTVILSDETGKEAERFATDKMLQKILVRRERWTYEPFAYFKDRSGGRLLKESLEIQEISLAQCFFTGCLARLNQNRALSPLAETERQCLLAALGPLPLFSLEAAFWSLQVELIRAAEKIAELYQEHKLIGPAMQTLPKTMGREGRAVLESPQGLIAHYYNVDEKGLVQELEILDPATENNVLRCLVVQKIVETGLQKNLPQDKIKGLLELGLLAV